MKVWFAGAVLIGLVFGLFLAGAVQVVLTSSGNSLFSATSSAGNLFNFSVEVTDSGATGNVSSVQVILPGNFSFISGIEGTNALGSFSSSSNSLTWTNVTGLVMNASINYFWFNASVSWPGQYNLSIVTTNVTGSYYSNLSVNVSDGSPPIVEFVSPGLTGHSNSTGSSITINASVSDYGNIGEILVRLSSSGSLVNSSRTYGSPSNYIQFTGLGNGIYKINVSSNDSMGNSNYTSNLQVILDSAGPSVTISLIDATQSTLNVSISASDSLTGISGTCTVSGEGNEAISGNGTQQSFYVQSLDCNDDFEYTVTCRDGLNNAGSDTKTFSTGDCQSSGTSSSAGSSGGDASSSDSEDFWTETIEEDESGLEELGNVSATLEETERLKIKVAGESFFVGVLQISDGSVKIQAGDLEKTINVDSGEKFDLNADDFYDILVTVKSVDGEEVELEVKYIHESAESFGIEPGAQVDSVRSKLLIGIIAGIVIVLAVAGFLIYKFYFVGKVGIFRRHR